MIGAGEFFSGFDSPAPIAYDFRNLFGLSIKDIGTQVTWGEAVLLLKELVKVETSRTYIALHNLDYPVGRADLYLLSILASFAGVKGKNYTKLMPWGSKPPTANVSRETFDKATEDLLSQFGISR